MKSIQLLAFLALMTVAVHSQANISIGQSGINVNGISVGSSGVYVDSNGISVGSSGVYVDSNDVAVQQANGVYRLTCRNNYRSIYVNYDNSEISIDGDCTSISVAGANNTVVANQTRSLVISGANNGVKVGRVDNIRVTGANNEVAYTNGLTRRKVVIDNIGANSEVVNNR